MGRRAGLLLHGLLAGIGVSGIALVSAGDLSVARLVTLFLVSSTFVGQIAMLANHLPDLQAGMGAVIRLRQMLAVAPEPDGGDPLPARDALDLDVRHLDFAYDEGTFALADVDLHVPAGDTIALVGRTGSGKSTLAALLSRAVEPPPGTVVLGGRDVRDLDLQQLRAAVGVVTQRTEILAGTLAENITLFAEHSREQVARRDRRARAWPTGSPGCPTAWTRSSGPAAPRCRPGRSSWSRSRGCWSATCGSSCSTRRPPAWTRSPSTVSWRPPTGCSPGAPAC